MIIFDDRFFNLSVFNTGVMLSGEYDSFNRNRPIVYIVYRVVYRVVYRELGFGIRAKPW